MSSVTAHEWSLSGMSRRWESLSLAGSGIRGQTRVGVLRIEGILLHLYPRGYASTWGRGCPRVRGVDMGRSLEPSCVLTADAASGRAQRCGLSGRARGKEAAPITQQL